MQLKEFVLKRDGFERKSMSNGLWCMKEGGSRCFAGLFGCKMLLQSGESRSSRLFEFCFNRLASFVCRRTVPRFVDLIGQNSTV